jgi:thiol-disulfide isomerase/thioredoxin
MTKKCKKLFSVLLMLVVFETGSSQALKVGDTVPDLLQKLNKYADKKLSVSDLKGKFFILDFWAHYCLSCLEAFPKMDSLQKEFDSELQIFLVNGESRTATDNMFARRKKLKKPSLPIISGDPFFHKYFPHLNVPMHVWIDSSAVVRYVTEGETTNRKSIGSFLMGKPAFVAKFYKLMAPSFFDSTRVNMLEFFSYVSQCNNDIAITTTGRQEYVELIANCATVKELYKSAYRERADLYFYERPGRVILELSKPNKYLVAENNVDEENTDYKFNYHLMLPKSREKEMRLMMRDDLNRYFNLKSAIEVRKTTCLVLTRTSSVDKLQTKGGKQILNFYYADERTDRYDSIRFFTNTPYHLFSKSIQAYVEHAFSMPFIDATGFDENIDFKMSGSMLDARDLGLFKNELLKYDLSLVEIERPIEALVISDN